MTKIIAFAGAQQSGKTTSVNLIHGYMMKNLDIIKDYKINELGQLVVNAIHHDDNGSYERMSVFDIDQESDLFIDYANATFWPYVKSYNFAYLIKDTCINMFGLTRQQVYGSDDDKNSYTQYKWENMPCYESENCLAEMAGIETKQGFMTAREFMRYWGTDICRKINKNVWVDSCLNRIKKERSQIALIGDCRFEDEIDSIHDAGGIVIYLSRNAGMSDHESEQIHKHKEKCDYELNNSELSVQEQCDELINMIEGGLL